MGSGPSPDDARVKYNTACAFAIANKPDEAIAHLKEALENLPSHLSDWPVRDPDMSNLWDHPEFIRLIGKNPSS